MTQVPQGFFRPVPEGRTPFRRYEASRVAFSDPLSVPGKQRDDGSEWRVYDKKNGKSLAAGSELTAKLAATVLTLGQSREPSELHKVAAEVLDAVAESMAGLAVYANGFVDQRAAKGDASDIAATLKAVAECIRIDYEPCGSEVANDSDEHARCEHFRENGCHELQPIDGTATGWRCWICGYTTFGDEGQG